MKRLRLLLLCLIGLILCANSFAQKLNVIEANSTLDRLSFRLSVSEVDANNLRDANSALRALQAKAKACVLQADEDISDLSKDIENTKIKESGITQVTEDQKFLLDKKKKIISERGECQLFVLRSQEAMDIFSDAVSDIETKQRLMVVEPVWDNFFKSAQILSDPSQIFTFKKFLSLSSIDKFNTKSMLLLLCCLALAIGLAWKLRSHLRQHIIDKSFEDLTDKIKQICVRLLHRHLYVLFICLGLLLFAQLFSLAFHASAYFVWLMLSVTAFYVLLGLIELFVYQSYDSITLDFYPDGIDKMLAARIRLFAIFCLVSFMVYISFSNQDVPKALSELSHTLFLAVFSIGLAGIIWVLTKIDWLLHKHHFLDFLLRLILLVGLATILILLSLGYYPLLSYLILSVSASLGLLLLAWSAQILLFSILSSVNQAQKPWQKTLRSLFGIKRNRQIFEIVWLRSGILLIIWSMFFVAMLRIWSLSKHEFSLLVDSLLNGFEFSGITIVPVRIVIAIFIFAAITLFTRWLRTHVARKTQATRSRGVQNSLVAIIGYTGFTLALIVFLFLTGINLTGLAFIAGALSVGIGFGLQNIVNNFVSGIILLIERPINPGDRVISGEHEGFVRTISIRSTTIRTLDHTDVIIPNSELIASQVINLMHGDNNTRLQIYVGVAYGSDTKLVHRLLMEVATENKDVINDDATRPLVLFREFADSSLNFELRIIIHEVNLRQCVRSDVLFAIDEKFREHGIEIPFPQRDLHIRDWPSKPSPDPA